MKALPKFIFYILSKWVLFYAYQFVEGSNEWSFDKVNGEGVFLTAFMLLALPLMELVILYFPVRWTLSQTGLVLMGMLVLVFALEFAIGWFATNQHFEPWMAIKIALSAVLFVIFYRKQITF